MHPPTSAATAQRMEAPRTTASNLLPSPAFRTLFSCLLLAAAVLACYNPVAKNHFLTFDDDRYIVDNPHVKAGLTRDAVKWAFTTYEEANWHPLTWLSHALDCQLFGLNAAGHHYVNVLLHAANSILLFLLLQYATGLRWRSLMVAALFALHPINVESVAWAAERKNVLSMLFFLLALYAYSWYARTPGVSRYLTMAGFFVLSLLSKPQVVTFPCLLLLWDYWPLFRWPSAAPDAVKQQRVKQHAAAGATQSLGRLLLEKVPLFLLSAASAAITIKAQKAGGAVKKLTEFGLNLRIETALISYARYVGKMFWPSKLAGLYPHPTTLYPVWQIIAATLSLLLVTAFLLLQSSRQRYLAVGWLWFLGSLVPMIGLVQVGLQSMADRYAYIPFIGLFVMVVWSVADWAEKRRISNLRLAVPALCSLLALGVLSHRQIGYWHDTTTFWRHALAVTSQNYVAEGNLGEVLFSDGKEDEGAEHFRNALAVRPDGLVANLDLGAYEDRRSNLPAAIQHYQVVIDHAGDVGMRATAYGSLGFVYRERGEMAKAKQCFETSVRLDDSRARARIGLGLVAQDGGDVEEAIRQYSLAASLQNSDTINILLARALEAAGRSDQAKTIYSRVAASPKLAESQQEVKELIGSR